MIVVFSLYRWPPSFPWFTFGSPYQWAWPHPTLWCDFFPRHVQPSDNVVTWCHVFILFIQCQKEDHAAAWTWYPSIKQPSQNDQSQASENVSRVQLEFPYLKLAWPTWLICIGWCYLYSPPSHPPPFWSPLGVVLDTYERHTYVILHLVL